MRLVTLAVGTILVVTSVGNSRGEEIKFADKNFADDGEAVGNLGNDGRLNRERGNNGMVDNA